MDRTEAERKLTEMEAKVEAHKAYFVPSRGPAPHVSVSWRDDSFAYGYWGPGRDWAVDITREEAIGYLMEEPDA